MEPVVSRYRLSDMKILRGILVGLLVAPALVVVGATQALACSCIPAQPDKVAAKDAKAVFAGTMVEADVAEPGFSPGVWTFDVNEVYKGEVERSQEVTSQTQSAACGLIFKEEKRYVVFAYENKGALETNSCMNTRPLEDGKEPKLDAISTFASGDGTGPGAGLGSTSDDPEGLDPIAIGAIGLLAVSALVAVAFLVARKRAPRRSLGAPGTPGGPPA